MRAGWLLDRCVNKTFSYYDPRALARRAEMNDAASLGVRASFLLLPIK